MQATKRQILSTKRGKSGLGLSGFSLLWQTLRWIFEWAGLYQTMTEIVPAWMLSPLFVPLLFISGVLLILWAISDKGDAKMPSQEAKAETHGHDSPVTIINKARDVSIHGRQEERVAHEIAPTLKPNIKVVAVRGARIGRYNFSDDIYHEMEGAGTLPAALVCFRNEARIGEAVAEPQAVVAQIIFLDPHGNEVDEVSQACWIGEGGAVTDFPVGQGRCAVAAIAMGAYVHKMEKTRAKYDEIGGEYFATTNAQVHPFTNVEVRLVAQGAYVMPPKRFNLELVDALQGFSFKQLHQ